MVTRCYPYRNVKGVYRIALKSLARRYLELHDEIAELNIMITSIVNELAPELIKRKAVGYECTAQLLATAGDNPQSLTSKSCFEALCGVSPVPYLLVKQIVTGLIVVVIVPPIVLCILSL